MKRSSRKFSSYWVEGNFEPRRIIVEGKGRSREITVAYCPLCKSNLLNTLEDRLRRHRKCCIQPKSAMVTSSLVNMDTDDGSIVDLRNQCELEERSRSLKNSEVIEPNRNWNPKNKSQRKNNASAEVKHKKKSVKSMKESFR